MKYFPYTYLKEFIKEVLIKIGHSEKDADLASSVLIKADLRGIDSHGLARLSGYVRLWEVGRINSLPGIKTTKETPTTAVVDADRALGLISAPKAMEIAIEKAGQVGSGWVAVNNSNHFGIAGYHAMMALEHDMIGFAMTNASPLVAPTYSKQRLLGTNPIAVAIPANRNKPFVLDMATTTAANGKLEVMERKNESVPVGWIQDPDGKSTKDPRGVKKGGALLPLGGDRIHGSHKGYGLGAVVDILCGVLSGANYGPWVPPFVAFLNPKDDLVGEGLGHFVGAFKIDSFQSAESFKDHMDNWIDTFRNSQVVDGFDKVLIPGEPEKEMEQQRIEKGIPLMDEVIQDLEILSEKFGLAYKFS